jgi:SAM-dependent methyltransferase
MYTRLSDVRDLFDVATAFDLIEHLYDVPGFLQTARGMLRPGGILILLTGDKGSLTARLHRERWWYLLAPEHIVFPSRASYVRAPGFRLVEAVPTYASRGYVPKPGQWVRALAMAALRRGSGLPLIRPDHHLLVLQRVADS